MRTIIDMKKLRGSLVSLAAMLLLTVLLAACGSKDRGTKLMVTPATAQVVTGLSIPLTANIPGVTWSVNGVAGGDATVGRIDASGLYTAPGVVPSPAVVTVTATTIGATQSASAQITITALALAGPGGGYAGTFTATGALKTARSNHTATLLPSGKVLVTGGIGSAGAPIADVEFYRPGFGNFSTAASMSTARAYHTATLLQNGTVLITGGFNENNAVLAHAELYHPETDTFSATGSMTVPRAYHTATPLPDGTVLIAGGSSSADLTTGAPLDSLEIYDPATGTFSAAAATVLNDARFSHSAILLNNGKVLLAGGIGVAGQKLATAELYDPASAAANKIAATGIMTAPRWLNTMERLGDGTILVVGGSSGTISGDVPSATYLSSAEIYDPVTGTFTDAGFALVDSRGFHTTTRLADGTALIAGGFGLLSSAPLTGSTLATAELFTSGAAFARTATDMPVERANHTATILPDSGKVLIIGGGGYSGGSFAVMNSALLYE